jgi:hypothetical protein
MTLAERLLHTQLAVRDDPDSGAPLVAIATTATTRA